MTSTRIVGPPEANETTHDGKIKCTLKTVPGQSEEKKVVYVQTPDDLFDLGYEEVNYGEFGVCNAAGVIPK